MTYSTGGQGTKVERGTVNSQSDSDWAGFSTLEEAGTGYDSHQRPIVQRLASGGTTYALTPTSHDSLGRANCVARRMNSSEFATSSLPSDACTLDTAGSYGPDRITRTSFDNAGRPNLVQTGYGVSGVQADEVATTYTHNARVATVTDAEGNRTSYAYDGHDRLARTYMPSPTTDNSSSTTDYEELTYVLAASGTRSTSLVSSRRLRDNTSIFYGYDALGRLTDTNRPGSELDTPMGYDILSRLTSISYTGHTQSVAYDALGRIVTQIGPVGGNYQILSSTYDLAGRGTRLDYGNSLYVDYVYNVAGDMTEVRENGATSGEAHLATYAYDDLGRRTSLTRGNGAVTSYSYDNVSRLSQLVHNPAGTSYDLTIDLSYNPARPTPAHATHPRHRPPPPPPRPHPGGHELRPDDRPQLQPGEPDRLDHALQRRLRLGRPLRDRSQLRRQRPQPIFERRRRDPHLRCARQHDAVGGNQLRLQQREPDDERRLQQPRLRFSRTA